MKLIDKIKIIERKRIIDSRGWFVKVINGYEEFLPNSTGEIYLIQADIGESRANHYHPIAKEWFTLIQGKALMLIEDVNTKEKMQIILDEKKPKTIFTPNYIAHSFNNIGDIPYILVAYADVLYDAADTIPYKII